ncbi:hypothetical protein B0I26_107114 [Anoxybacillus vitaminiphilus]|uniref:Membrane protein YczE n=1 Tax=Paranoxybacillus vitaminiphilus TaxID=581036 RepID=A0A327YHB4_9BACL|nr:DUF6198 family protein [Anoxybacillus vitaminiphilus]RAK19195.1 hypothetical protein B0I26_107114 [Anoxybacillus vitaminiphilus]
MIYRFLFYIVGLFIISFGVALTIKADLGAGAWDALNVGLAETIGFTVGTWVVIVGAVLMSINAILLRRFPEILAIATIIIIGMFIDFWLKFIFDNWEPSGLLLRFLLFLLGLIVISIGVSIYLQAKFPLNPIDQFMMVLKEKLKITLMTAKTIGEVLALILALAFNGPIGVGTIVITLLIGPFIQFFFPKFEHLFKQMSKSH